MHTPEKGIFLRPSSTWDMQGCRERRFELSCLKIRKKKRRVAGGKEAIEVKISPSHVRPRKDKTEKERASRNIRKGRAMEEMCIRHLRKKIKCTH